MRKNVEVKMEILRAIEETSLAISYIALALISYIFSPHYKFIKNLALRLGDKVDQPEAQIYLERLFGFVLLGLIPAVVFPALYHKSLADYGLAWPTGRGTVLWWIIPLVVFVLMGILRPSKGVNVAFYPQVRKETWGVGRTAINLLSWAVYLAGYEFAFRGLLFFSCLSAFGLIPAIAINCAIYSISHIPKGMGEAFGAFFMGILFCVIAYYSGSFIIPFVLHLVLAVGNDLKAIAINPLVQFSFKKPNNGTPS